MIHFKHMGTETVRPVKHIRRLSAIAAAILAMLAVLATTGCTGREPAAPPKPATTTITYPKDSLNTIFHDDDPKIDAESLKEWTKYQGDDYFTNVYAKPNGNVVVALTAKQRKKLIENYTNTLDVSGMAFKEINPDYDYNYSGITKTLSIWADSKADTVTGPSFIAEAPMLYGELYYTEGGTGPWDMDIYIYGCHSRKLYQHYKASQGPLFNFQAIPE